MIIACWLCTSFITSSITIGCNGAYKGVMFVATFFDIEPSTFIFTAHVVGWRLGARLEGG